MYHMFQCDVSDLLKEMASLTGGKGGASSDRPLWACDVRALRCSVAS